MGYALAYEHWGKGIATEALRVPRDSKDPCCRPRLECGITEGPGKGWLNYDVRVEFELAKLGLTRVVFSPTWKCFISKYVNSSPQGA
ncbi:hypothetical protein EJ110_NYTH26079 [Nymphaea thermarum]|nr:hypothetical protein EJ110_NYTH26079 [Nymphaea thermarum]